MTKPWIQKLADDIKIKDRDAAEVYARQKHESGVIGEKGKPFFDGLVSCLERDLAEFNAALEADPTGLPTTLAKEPQANATDRYVIKREQFPQVSATLLFSDDKITLKAEGREQKYFGFLVDENDRLSAREMFAENSEQFDQPDELAKYVMEFLFAGN